MTLYLVESNFGLGGLRVIMYFSISFFLFHLSLLHPPIGDRREDFSQFTEHNLSAIEVLQLDVSAEKLSLEIFRKSPTGNVTSFSSTSRQI